jgi:hypothetical protein
MKKFVVNITTENAAFEDDPAGEIARILRRLADNVDVDDAYIDHVYHLRDANGNLVGRAEAK